MLIIFLFLPLTLFVECKDDIPSGVKLHEFFIKIVCDFSLAIQIDVFKMGNNLFIRFGFSSIPAI